jgi:hypothetical protein
MSATFKIHHGGQSVLVSVPLGAPNGECSAEVTILSYCERDPVAYSERRKPEGSRKTLHGRKAPQAACTLV